MRAENNNMAQFKASLKKELLELNRTKKSIVYLAICIVLAIISNTGFVFGYRSSQVSSVVDFNRYCMYVFTCYYLLTLLSSAIDELKLKRLASPILMGLKPLTNFFAKIVIQVLLPLSFLLCIGVLNVGLNFIVNMHFDGSLILSVCALCAAELFLGIITLSLTSLCKNTILGVILSIAMVVLDSVTLIQFTASQSFPSAYFQYATGLSLPITANQFILYSALMVAYALLTLIVTTLVIEDRHDLVA